MTKKFYAFSGGQQITALAEKKKHDSQIIERGKWSKGGRKGKREKKRNSVSEREEKRGEGQPATSNTEYEFLELELLEQILSKFSFSRYFSLAQQEVLTWPHFIQS